MAFNADMPDWAFSVGLGQRMALPPTTEQVVELYTKSPISKPIIRPLLLFTGGKDVRVPISSAQTIHSFIKYQGITKSELYHFPNCGHVPIDTLEIVEMGIITFEWLNNLLG
jgi:pimeloyl-ACP methyl ester carboxylesterase